jgi:hypothetical protein
MVTAWVGSGPASGGPSGVEYNRQEPARRSFPDFGSVMGYEYRITTDKLSSEVADRILKTAGNGAASRVNAGYEYRVAGSVGLPSAFASVEAYGFYVCAYGRHGLCAEIVGYIVSAAAAFGTVRLEESE